MINEKFKIGEKYYYEVKCKICERIYNRRVSSFKEIISGVCNKCKRKVWGQNRWKIVNCSVCNKEIKINLARFNSSKNKKFCCSYKCNGIFKKGRKAWNKIENYNICRKCGKQFKVANWDKNKKYCSYDCLKGRKFTAICESCGKSFERENWWKSNKKFCSFTCYDNWKILNRIPDEQRDYPYEFTEFIRQEIWKRDNYTCQLCNKTKCKVNAHHIDYNKNNNELNNLLTLCTSCHTKTNYRRDFWQNFFKKELNINY